MAKRSPLFLVAALVLLLVVGSMGINVASTEHGVVGRRLLQGGGCAKWVTPKGGKKTCVGCSSGWDLKGGACYKSTKGYVKGPINTYGYKSNSAITTGH